MNQKPSQLRLALSRCHAVTRCGALLVSKDDLSTRSAISGSLSQDLQPTSARNGRAGDRACRTTPASSARPGKEHDRMPKRTDMLLHLIPAPRTEAGNGVSPVNPLQLPLGDGDRAFDVLTARAVVGEHIQDEEIRDRGGRLFADGAQPSGG